MEPNPLILKAIKLAGSTQAGLAERSGLSQQYISKLLFNKKRASVDAAIKLSRATDGALLISDFCPEVVDAVAQELGIFASSDEAAR